MINQTKTKKLIIFNKIDLIKLNLADKILVPSKYIYKEVIKKGVSVKGINIFRPYMPNRNFLKLKRLKKEEYFCWRGIDDERCSLLCRGMQDTES